MSVRPRAAAPVAPQPPAVTTKEFIVNRSRLLAAPALALALVAFAACGDDSEQQPADTTVVTTPTTEEMMTETTEMMTDTTEEMMTDSTEVMTESTEMMTDTTEEMMTETTGG